MSLSGWGLIFWCHRIEFAFQKETKLLEVWWFQCHLFVLWFWVFIYCFKCLPPAFWFWMQVSFMSCWILKFPHLCVHFLSLFFLICCTAILYTRMQYVWHPAINIINSMEHDCQSVINLHVAKPGFGGFLAGKVEMEANTRTASS